MKMGKRCVVCKKCGNSTEKRTFHSMPKDEDRRRKWMKILNLQTTTRYTCVCSDHFNKEDFLQYLIRPKLKTEALPRPFVEIAGNMDSEEPYHEEEKVDTEDLQLLPEIDVHKEVDVKEITVGPLEIQVSKSEGPCSSCRQKLEEGFFFLLNNGGAALTNDLYQTAPRDFFAITQNVSVLRCLPKNVIFGPYGGVQPPPTGNDGINIMRLYNWLQFIPFSTDKLRCNLNVFQFDHLLYFRTFRDVACKEQLVAHLDEKLIKEFPNDSGRYYYPLEETIPHVYACVPCCLGFKSEKYLQRHIRSCIRNRAGLLGDITPCKRCDMVSCAKSYHHRHRYKNCVTSKSEIHIINDYKRPEAHKCTMCDAVYKRKANLEKHMNAHKNGKRYSCQRCDFKTNRRGCLNSHSISKHGFDPRKEVQTFKCKICYEEFTNRGPLTLHMRTVHNGKKPYECEYCDQKYAWPESLMIHTRLHTREKLHTCQICKRDFVQICRLKKHVKTHAREGYPCAKCHYRATTSDALNTHVQRVHATLY